MEDLCLYDNVGNSWQLSYFDEMMNSVIDDYGPSAFLTQLYKCVSN